MTNAEQVPDRDHPCTRRDFLHGAACAISAALASWFAAGAHAATGGSSREQGGGPRENEVIEALLSRMTLAEKLGQMTQSRGRVSITDPHLPEGSEDQIRAGHIGSFLGIFGAVDTRRLQRIAVEESRLRIPLLFADDVIHGFRTIFPVPLAEAATFDVDAVENAARIAAVEATAHGLHWTFAPMVDVARDPRWGRIVEGSGEDSYLGSVLAAARVRGFQGRDLSADDTMLATAKHFAAYGAAEGGRDYNIAEVSQRTLRETYLPPFHAAVRAGVQAVMAAFNEVAGVPMHANQELIEGVLRSEWGFEGIVISDYTGVRELLAQGVAANPQAAGVLALRAGIDVDMVSGIYLHDVPEVVHAGRLPESAVDRAVLRLLRAKYRLGLFDDPYRYCDAGRERARTLTPEHRKAARDMARKSLVLLKNDGNTLPLSKHLHTIAVIGPLADDRRAMLGSWIAAGRAEDVVTPLEGIRAAVASGTRVLYAKGASVEGADSSGFADAERVAREADAVVLFVGEHHDMSGEARSRSSLDLPGVQEGLARTLKATGKPLVVVLFTGRPLSIAWLAQNVPSILLAWFPGVEAGHALADILFGADSPAGRLPVTFPRTVGQVPIYYNHKNTGRPPDWDDTRARPKDDKNTSRYVDVPPTPLYPFGHGLGYTTFSYQHLQLSADHISLGGTLEVQVEVTNTGNRAGDEVVQLYLHETVASITRPVKQLRGFRRIHLAPGERRKLTFELGPEDLAFYGLDLRPVVEPGSFTVMVGGSSTSLIEATFDVARA
jgi:beta-glucosidase